MEISTLQLHLPVLATGTAPGQERQWGQNGIDGECFDAGDWLPGTLGVTGVASRDGELVFLNPGSVPGAEEI